MLSGEVSFLKLKFFFAFLKLIIFDKTTESTRI